MTHDDAWGGELIKWTSGRSQGSIVQNSKISYSSHDFHFNPILTILFQLCPSRHFLSFSETSPECLTTCTTLRKLYLLRRGKLFRYNVTLQVYYISLYKGYTCHVPRKMSAIFEKVDDNLKSPLYFTTFINRSVHTSVRLPAVQLLHNKTPTQI
jgi:hypothetical protein